MAVPAHSTGAIIAHLNEDLHPRDLPALYTVQVLGDKMLPKMMGGSRQNFSTTIEPKRGDIAALWFTNDGMQRRGYRFVVLRLLSVDDHLVVAHTLSPVNAFRFRRDEIAAIHVWIGKGPIFGVKGDEPKPMPAPATAPVTEQTELSLLAPTADGPLTMSSREIAELTEKRHGDVIRDTRVLLDAVLAGWENDDAKLRHQGISITYDNRGYVSEIRLPKDLTITLVAGYDANLRLKIVRRWMELEGATKKPAAPEFPIPQTYSEALMLAANQAAQIEHQKTRIVEKDAQIADMRDDVDALDRIAGADGLFGVRETVAMLQTKERKFVAWLQQNGWAYRQTGSKRLLAYADKRKAGYATHKARVYEKPDGSEGVDEALKFTPAGIVKLAKLLSVTLTDADLRMLHGDKGRAA